MRFLSDFFHSAHRGLHGAQLIALFFCLSFVVSITLPPVSAYALSKPEDATYPGALDTTKSNIKPAADATPSISGETHDTALASDQDSGPGKKQQSKHEEIVTKRTANTKTFDMGNGKLEVRNYMGPVHFKTDGHWKQIDTSLVEDANAAESTNLLGKGIAWVKGKTQTLHTYKVKANDWQAKFAASDDPIGMVRVQAGGKNVQFSPKGAKAGVTPTVQKNDQGVETVTYKDLWPGVDVVYMVKNETLKEEIHLKSNSAATDFSYDIKGASLQKNANGGFSIDGTKQTLSELSVTLQKAGPTSEKVVSQNYKNGVLRISLDKSWLKKQANEQFPVVIDPTWSNSSTVSWGYTSYKSDGYVCSPAVCYMNAGELYDNGWKNWRTVFCTGDISFLSGKVLLGSSMYLQQANRSYLVGYNGPRYYIMQHASYFGYNGMDGGAPANSGLVNYGDGIDTTAMVRFEVSRADWGPCWSLWGEEYAANTWKGFDADISYMAYAYSTTPATPTVVSPQPEQTFTDPQVSFQVNPVGDADGDAVQYYFRIATGADGETGTIINSGDLNTTQWTVPDGILQDGKTYYLHAYTRDPYAYSAPSAPIKFKIDSRRGKDKTQTYDTVGPVSVDLTNGNVSTSVSSHDTTALGGSLGVSLDYNSPMRSRQGLVGSYWNNTSQSGSPVVTRVDKNVNFNWVLGSPSADVVSTDNFSARWTGYFVAPKAGTYYFGGSNDDGLNITVNNQLLYAQGCYSGVCYDTTKSVTLSAGQVVPIQLDYTEWTGNAYALLYVKGAVAEQVVPQEWLQTGARSVAQPHGLTGSYYANNAGYYLDGANKSLLVRRIDSVLNFNWGTAGPVPNTNADFMTRWTGYITLADGDYTFGTNADDGSKITIGNTKVVDNYTNGCCAEKYGSTVHFNAGTYPIQIDYYDVGGPAALSVLVKVNGGAGQVIPTEWLSPSAQVLPSGWQLGVDPDGDLSYDHLSANESTVTLSDSTGDTHVYSWTGSGYRPPVNEDGQLTKNADGTYTLIDTDGRTYVFNADGTLASVTDPTDDRKPAALKYTYEGTPAHITQITDGVDSGRYAKIYYSADGKGKCAATPDSSYLDPGSGLLTGYICAVQTNDGRTTSFFYAKNGDSVQLALVVKPGNERTSYQYDTNGMVTGVRDSLAEDAIAQSVRAKDDTTITKVSYDVLGRATGITAPAATATAPQQQQTYEYVPYAAPLVRYINPSIGDRFVTTGSAPAGYVPEPHISASLLLEQASGTYALYSCRVNSDQFVSTDANCEGQYVIGLIGYVYGAAQPDGLTVPIYRCTLPGDHFVSHTANCEGYTTESLLGYAISGTGMLGSSRSHVVGDSEPNGFARRVDYDATFRTTRDTDVTGKQTLQQWDAVKDLLYSTTDATGLKSTTLYDSEDRPTDSYGPAPAAWFGADRKPLAAYDSQVPRTSTGYDEGIVGPAVAYMNVSQPTSSYILGNNQTLYPGQSLVSADGQFRLTHQTDGNVVLYGPEGQRWSTNTANRATTALIMQTDGNLVLYNGGTPVWYTATGGGPSSYLNLQNDGNLVIYNSAGAQWSTGTPGATPITTSRASLSGAPLLHATNIGGPAGQVSNNFGATSPVPGKTTNWGMRLTGKLVLPTTGNWGIRIWSDNGVRMSIDDTVVIDDWKDGGERNHPTYTYNNVTANTPHRVSIDYYHLSGNANFAIYMTAPGQAETQNVAQYFVPDYSLETSQTVYGAPTAGGATATVQNKTNYGANPELGLVQSASTDATGLNLTATSTYEAPGAAYLRQTSSTLPGGATTKYTYYGATDVVTNPCNSAQSFHQGGMLKLKTEPDPDGTGTQTSRTVETVYDDAGKVAATRYNTDAWTCTTYDSRERVLTTTVPAYNGAPARTITNNYSVGGNPLVTSSADASGTITIETDLLGRNVKYTDAKGNVTTSTYDAKGHLSQRVSVLGTEDFVYDDVDRLTDQKLDGTVYAHINYDTYSRIDSVTYPAAGQQKLTYTRDTLGRLNGATYNGSIAPKGSSNLQVLTKGAATASVSSAAGGSYVDTLHSATTFTLTGLNAAYDATKATQFGLNLDAGTKSGVATQLRVSYDFTGDGTWDRTETYKPMALNATAGYEKYTDAAGVSGTTGQFANLVNGKVKVEVWNTAGSAAATVATPSAATDPLAALVTLPYIDASQGNPNTTIAADQVVRATTGDVVSGTELGQAKSYSYDTAGRLIAATVAGTSYTYGYGAADSSCSSLAGNNADAGKDSNRTTQTVNGVATTFCYDQADRIIGSSNTLYKSPMYDSHGNMTQIGSGTVTKLTYDSSDRNLTITEGTKKTTYTRDVQGRLLTRQIVNGTTTTNGYAYTASGDTPDALLTSTGAVSEKYLSLPGNVLLTIRPSQTGNAGKVYSLPNIHGDVFATTDASGTLTGTFQTGPFGETITGQTTPNNTATNGTLNYVGQHQKLTETSFAVTPIQMGARVYFPGLGRFASVDPQQGGTPNNYVYPPRPGK